MHGGHLQSVYLVAPTEGTFSPRPEESQPQPKPAPVAPPKTLPRSTVPPPKQPVATVPRPITVGTLREAKAATATRVPIDKRSHEPEVPARLKLKKKTVAFGVTTNVSQTVEREKDHHHPTEPQQHRAAAAAAATSKPPAPPPRMSLARAGVGADRAGTRPPTRQTSPPRAPLRDENRRPAGGGEERESRREEKKDSIGRLEAHIEELQREVRKQRERIVELEGAERKQREAAAEVQRGFEGVIKIVSTLTARIAELELEKENGGGGGGRERSNEANGPRRRLYSSEEQEEENGGRREEERKGRRTGTGNGLFSDEALRAIGRQASTNPVLRRHLQDAYEQEKYEHEYGGGRGGGRGGGGERRTVSPPQRRGYFDEYSSEPRAAAGRCGAGSAPNHQRWKEEPRRERLRTTPPGGGGRAGVTRKRTEITPSRRRVTERVTMERVHTFDDTDDDDESGGGDMYNRYDSDDQQYPAQTEYSEEIVESADFQSAIQQKGRAAYGGRQPAPRRTQQQQHYGSPRRGAPLITEMEDSDGDSVERKQRKIREMKEEMRRRRGT